MKSAPTTRLIINGAHGKMGARINALALDDERFNVVAALDVDDAGTLQKLARDSVDAIIDFSTDQGAQQSARFAQEHGCALLVGVTGLSQKTLDLLGETGKRAAVMIAPNTSLGVAVINHLVAEAARLLGREFDIDLIESHHSMKRDAPSGTALRLARTLRDECGIDLPADRIHSIRAGDVIGEHSVEFSGPGEKIKIFHSASNRDLFARGALRAAAWLAGRPAGLYSIEQSLGIETSKRQNV